MNIPQRSALDARSLLARRIEETQNIRADHLREVDRLDNLLMALQSEFNEITNSLAPIASIPNEVLSAIFEAGCLLSQSEGSEPSFEIIVSQVTRHWRDVATSTSSLWTQINVSSRKSMDMVDAYFRRSRILPLDIRVDMWPGSLPTSSIALAITPHVGRWRRLSVQCHRRRRDLLSMFRYIYSSASPLLEYVQISLEETGDDEDENEDVDADEEDTHVGICKILTGGAPSLKTIRIKGIGLDCCMPPASMVTVLHIHRASSEFHFTYTTMCAMFGSLSALTHLVLHGDLVSDFDLPTGSTSRITFPSLSSLHILSSNDTVACVPILAIVSAPLLECLFLEDICDDDIRALLEDPGWSTTSPRYPCLHTLTMTIIERPQPSTWRLIARSFATVTDLALLPVEIRELSAVLYAIDIESNSGDIPWPNLEMLSLGQFPFPDDIEPLSIALSARSKMGRPLRKLRIHKHKNEYATTHAIMQLRQYTDVEEYELKRWGLDDLDDWYDGD